MTMNQYIVFWSLIRKSKAAPGPQHTDPDRPEGWLARPRRTSTSICWTPSWVPSFSRLSYRSVKTPIAREKGEAVDLFAIEMMEAVQTAEETTLPFPKAGKAGEKSDARIL